MRPIILSAVICTGLFAQKPAWEPAPGHAVIPLWPNAAAGAASVEVDKTTPKDNLIAGRPLIRLGNVSSPALTLYAPKGKNTGAAVVVFPGGGYSILAIDLEGTEVCDWLTSVGVTCVLVKYRVPGTGPYPKSAAALDDAQRAAGAHLAVALSTHFDKRLYERVDAADELSCRPDFAVVVYPGYLAVKDKPLELNPDVPVTSGTPPAFIVMAEDDPVGVDSAIVFFWASKQARVAAELHLYAEGGHGYGLRKTALPVTGWPKGVEAWLRTIRMVQ